MLIVSAHKPFSKLRYTANIRKINTSRVALSYLSTNWTWNGNDPVIPILTLIFYKCTCLCSRGTFGMCLAHPFFWNIGGFSWSVFCAFAISSTLRACARWQSLSKRLHIYVSSVFLRLTIFHNGTSIHIHIAFAVKNSIIFEQYKYLMWEREHVHLALKNPAPDVLWLSMYA